MPENPIGLDVVGQVAVVTLDRAEKRNALNAAMIDGLAKACRTIEHDATIRIVILTGAGNRAFSSGGDIQAWSDMAPDDFGRFWLREGHDAFAAVARLRQPVIAVLNGDVYGGGLELAACADLRIAEQHVRIALPETGLGIIPGWSGTQRAARRFGAQLVRRMALFGEVFDTGQALGLGIVDHVTEGGAGMTAARQIAERVCGRAPLATELTKMLVNAAEGEESERILEAMAGIAAARSPDLQEGLAAFREKRPARF
ncbi:enoyl-CoA hydratase/isomerase family protein [Mesorhizobium tamadayense]|uniref:Enoyl-CoA hydratase/isomerase family protein n=1 Tax=Mesorhizobium tamadayense TaxID=425306 RepID=A0A3P3F6R9_9HYPH|nr:enoyl-CoA hydratase/isomerase family protein [Mesorhizobium tamadayense]RRH93298.1 enoyl-CoA hydratase/isomerase family protein [Mesorhizobium tamadayense]